MAGSKEVTIRAQTLDGTWDVLGSTRARGVWPEGVTLEADLWGSSRASFSLRRDPTSFWPDIGAFTPIEVDVGSTLAWSGRISETPARVAQRVISCQAEGWQYHLDDDLYERRYVSTKLSEWRDARESPATNLGRIGMAAASVVTGGVITLGWPKGVALGATQPYAAIYLDMGANSVAKRVITTFDLISRTGSAGVFSLSVQGKDDRSAEAAGEVGTNLDLTTWTSGSTANVIGTTFTTPRRYVFIVLTYNPAGAATTGEDNLLRFTGLQVFADTAYESGSASALKASTVVADAISRGTVRLSTDTTGITSTSFNIPEYAPTDPQTPRQAWQAVDSFHDWHKQIDVNKRPVYTARPSRPIFEVGAWSAIDDDDASANSGEEIYNRALITAQTPDGQPITDTRVGGHVGQLFSSTGLSTSWSGVGSGGISTFTGGAPNTGPYRKGVTYAVRVRSISHTQVGGSNIDLELGDNFAGDAVPVGSYPPTYAGPGAFFLWTPTADRTNFGFKATFHGMPDNDSIRIDSEVWSGNTIAERRGFRRTKTLPINAALPSDNAASSQIGDTWLTGHRTTPFRGSVTLTGDSSLRNILTGHNVPLETLLLNTGQLLRFSDRSDPDTGGHSRDGRIAAVSYQPASDTAQVTIDNSRTSFEALMSRLAVIQGG